MSAPNKVVFLLDVDNTLLDNDRVAADLRGLDRALYDGHSLVGESIRIPGRDY